MKIYLAALEEHVITKADKILFSYYDIESDLFRARRQSSWRIVIENISRRPVPEPGRAGKGKDKKV